MSDMTRKSATKPSILRIIEQTLAALLLAWLFLRWSTATSQTARAQTGPVSVTVSINANPSPALVGEAVQIQVQVSALQSPLMPTGTVEIHSDLQQACTITLDAQGQGACALVFSKEGGVTLQAIYPGDTPFLPGLSEKYLLPVVMPGDMQVYEHNFETPAGSEWTSTQRDTAPNGENFLGQFGNETVRLHLVQLPAHQWARVTFSLYIIASWDGNQIEKTPFALPGLRENADLIIGPDQWLFRANDTTYLNTTFTNWRIFRQAYPGFIGVGDFPAQTGAQDINHLGYSFGGIAMDATYPQTFTFIHQADSLTLDFSALGLQEITDESWGIDNLIVTVNNAPAYPIFLPLIHQAFPASP